MQFLITVSRLNVHQGFFEIQITDSCVFEFVLLSFDVIEAHSGSLLHHPSTERSHRGISAKVFHVITREEFGVLGDMSPIDVVTHLLILEHDFEQFSTSILIREGDVWDIFKWGTLRILLSSLLMTAVSRSQGRLVAPRMMTFLIFPFSSVSCEAPSIWTRSSDLTFLPASPSPLPPSLELAIESISSKKIVVGA